MHKHSKLFFLQDIMPLQLFLALCSPLAAGSSEPTPPAREAREFAALTARRERNPFTRFLADRRGATALEFGLVLGPTVLTATVIFQIAYCYFAEGVLDRAAFRGARAVLTGVVSQQGLTQAQFITQYICPELPNNLNCNNIVVNLTVAQNPPAASSIQGKSNVILP